jgi:fatty acid desaturase
MSKKVLTPQSQAMGADAPITRRELKALMRRSNVPALIRLPLWYGALATTGVLIWLALGTWWLIPAMFAHGIIMVHHFSLQHECIHFTAFRTRWLNDVVATWCGFWIAVPPHYFRWEHCDHHTHTQIMGRDPELIPLADSVAGHLLYISSLPYWRGMITGLVGHALGRLNAVEKRFVPKEERAAVVLEARIFLALYLAVTIAMPLLDWWSPLWFWFLPVLMGEPVMRFIRMTEHVGRPNCKDMTVNTRTSLVSWPWRNLCWNMSFHAEHHFAASVPFHALPKLHERLKGQLYAEPGGYLAAHRDMLGQLRGSRERLGAHVNADA